MRYTIYIEWQMPPFSPIGESCEIDCKTYKEVEGWQSIMDRTVKNAKVRDNANGETKVLKSALVEMLSKINDTDHRRFNKHYWESI